MWVVVVVIVVAVVVGCSWCWLYYSPVVGAVVVVGVDRLVVVVVGGRFDFALNTNSSQVVVGYNSLARHNYWAPVGW